MTDSNENPLLEKRTTSQKNDEQEANPYNQKKDYLDYDSMEQDASKPFAGANTMAGAGTNMHIHLSAAKSTSCPPPSG